MTSPLPPEDLARYARYAGVPYRFGAPPPADVYAPAGRPMDAAYMAGQIIAWTRMLEHLVDLVPAEIAGDGGDALDDIDKVVAGITDADIDARLAALVRQWQDNATGIRACADLPEYARGRADAMDGCAADALSRLRNPGLPPVEDGVRAAAVAVRAVAASYAAAGQPQPDGQTETAVAALPGMVAVSAQDLRDALEEWGYEGPVPGDLPVFRLTRAAYGTEPGEPR